MGFSTDCIHAGQQPEVGTGAVTIPIYQTSTYVQPKLGEHKGYEYARTQNPTRGALEANLAALEKGRNGRCFASGMAAIDTVFRLLKSGDHVIAGENMYGGSYRLFSRVLEKFGLQFTYVDTSNSKAIEQAFRPSTRFLFLETPTNPMMTLTAAAHRAGMRHRGALHHQVSQRPLRLGGRSGHHQLR
jgi:cystathionine gamma-lyase